MKPILSLCIPTYNRMDTLKETIDSILVQIDSNIVIDIFVSDNASTDNTQGIVEQYQKHSPFIRYQKNLNNVGFDGNIVNCIKCAIGEYIWFVSDDDILLKGTLKRVIEEIVLHKPTILYLNHQSFATNVNNETRPKAPLEDKIYSDGKEYFLKTGLGFISALILKLDMAKHNYQYGINCLFGAAHIEIASRIALKECGPFQYLGSLPVMARVPQALSDDYFTCHRLNVDKLYLKLEFEGLLDHSVISAHLENVMLDRAASILHRKCIGNHNMLIKQKDDIIGIYGKYRNFYLCMFPILIVPRWLIIVPYAILHKIITTVRKFRYEY